MILCEKILGSMADPAFADCQADYVEIEWHEAYKRLHQKTTGSGLEIGIRLDTDILTRGLREGDILWQDDNWVIAVTIPPCEAIVIDVDAAHPEMVAKVCYELGNKHAALLWGETEMQFVTPYNEPTLQLLNKQHGVTACKKLVKFNFDKSISSTVSSHTH